MNNIAKWTKEVQKLLARLSAAGQPGICTFRQGYIEGCEAAGFDDSGWKRVMGKGAPIPGIATDTIVTDKEEVKLDLCNWSMVDGPAAMRKKIKLDDKIEGLPTEGSKLYITLTMLAPLEVYIDGKKAASYRYWGDTRQCELVVTEHYAPGTTHTIVFKTPQNDGDAHLGVCFNFGVVEQAMLELATSVEQIAFAQRLATLHKGTADECLAQLEAFLKSEPVRTRDWEEIRKMLAGIDKILAALDPLAKEFKVHIIAHSHLDMNWLWDYEDTVNICVRDFRTLCDIMDENPDLRFSQSQTCVYDIVQKNDPETFARVLEKIREGSWEVTAATWSEHDLNLSGSEIFAHQLLTASDYVRSVLKTEPSRVCWEPDTFGFPASAPNVLTKAGVEYFYHFRCGSGHSLNWWEGTDGSRLLDFCFGPYNNSLRPNNIMPVTYELFDKYGLKNAMFVFGVGDHGGGPTRNDIRIKRYLDGKPCLPKLVFSKVCDFFDEVLREKQDYPVVRGEQNFIFEGCYTTKTEIKKLLRHGEARLLDAEAILALKRLGGANIRGEYEKIAQAWEKVCFNGFHDIACGCNIKAADRHDFKIGREAIEAAQAIISRKAEASSDSFHITVVNQLGAMRDELVCTEAPDGLPETGFLSDEFGQMTPYQINDGKLHFVAFDLPAFSTVAYRFAEGEVKDTLLAEMHDGTEDGSVCTLESAKYRLQVSPRTGTIVTLYDKQEKRHVLQHFRGEPEVSYAFRGEKTSNVLTMQYEEPHIMSAWVIGNISETKNLLKAEEVALVALGPVMAKLKIIKSINDTKIIQYITLYADLERIDFEIEIDWHEMGHYSTGIPMLKVGFSSDVPAPEYIYETPMGYVERNASGREVPALRYVVTGDEDKGFSLFNDCKHGFFSEGNTLYMTLVRGSYSPDARPDEGIVAARYAVFPYHNGRNMAEISEAASSFTQPPVAFVGVFKAQGAEGSNLFVADNNIVITCIKPAHNGSGIIVRMVESGGQRTDTTLSLNLEDLSAYETDLTERILRPLPYDGEAAAISFMPHEIKTILFEVRS